LHYVPEEENNNNNTNTNTNNETNIQSTTTTTTMALHYVLAGDDATNPSTHAATSQPPNKAMEPTPNMPTDNAVPVTLQRCNII
jgi:hypothetical protein